MIFAIFVTISLYTKKLNIMSKSAFKNALPVFILIIVSIALYPWIRSGYTKPEKVLAMNNSSIP